MKWTSNYTVGGVCIIACTGSSGTAANELNQPRDIKFDASGNLYVSDRRNHRIQKFVMETLVVCPTSEYSAGKTLVETLIGLTS
jgi:NHL repeat